MEASQMMNPLLLDRPKVILPGASRRMKFRFLKDTSQKDLTSIAVSFIITWPCSFKIPSLTLRFSRLSYISLWWNSRGRLSPSTISIPK
jgi:hypothetical protein